MNFPAPALRCFAILGALLALTACTAEVTEAPPGSTGSTGSGGAEARCDDGLQNGAETGVDCGGPACAPCPELFDCQAVCGATADNGCFDSASCQETCVAGAPGWSAEVRAAFTTCATGVPLCYQTLEDCMLIHLYPDPVVQQATLTGTGFEAFEGHSVYASIEKPGGEMVAAPAQKVSGGAFAFDWSISMGVSGAGLMLYYIDVDESGGCSFPADRAGSIFAERSQGFALPSWKGSATPPENPEAYAFVCDSL